MIFLLLLGNPVYPLVLINLYYSPILCTLSRYHRAFIQASNEYLKDFIKKDELLVNVIDYFTERYNEIKSDGTEGEMKSFHVHEHLARKKDKIENMKKQFVRTESEDGKLVFKSFRET